MPPPQLEGLSYWAPEVAERDRHYYMFYSAGGINGEGHKIRMASSASGRTICRRQRAVDS